MNGWVKAIAPPLVVLTTSLLSDPVAGSGRQRSTDPERGGRLEIQVRGLHTDVLADTELILVAEISPARDAEQGNRWQRELAVDGSGFAAADVGEGEWIVTFVVRSPTGAGSIIGSREVAVSANQVSRVELDLERRVYSGSLFRQGVPVQARLRLDARENRALSPVNINSRPDGAFTVIVPQPGHYDVTVWDHEDASSVVVTNVSFEEPAEGVEIHLPSTSIGGQVLGPGGAPARAAAIWAVKFPDREVEDGGYEGPGGILTASARTDEAGYFDLAGLTAGRWELRARQDELRSDPATIAIQTNEVRSDVTLILREGLRVRGSVSTSSGDPVPGAHGEFVAVPLEAEEVAPVLLFETDSQGQFDETYGRVKASVAHVTVISDDLPVTVRRVAMSNVDELQIQVPERSSEIRLLFEEVPGQLLNLNRFVLVAQDGGLLSLGALTAFGGASTQKRNGVVEMHIPRLPHGRWRVVRFSTLAEGLSALGKDPEELPTVAEFSLGPAENEYLELRLSGAN